MDLNDVDVYVNKKLRKNARVKCYETMRERGFVDIFPLYKIIIRGYRDIRFDGYTSWGDIHNYDVADEKLVSIMEVIYREGANNYLKIVVYI